MRKIIKIEFFLFISILFLAGCGQSVFDPIVSDALVGGPGTSPGKMKLSFLSVPSNLSGNTGDQIVVNVSNVSDASVPFILTAFLDANCTEVAPQDTSSQSQVAYVSGNKVTFNNIKFPGSGQLYFRVTSDGSQSECSSALSLNTGVPHHLEFSQQPEDVVLAGENLSPGPIVKVADFSSNLSPSDVPISLEVFRDDACTDPASAGSWNQLSSAGVAEFPTTSLLVTGTYYLKASSPGLGSACSERITVINNGSTKLSFNALPLPAITGESFKPVIQVSLFDSYANVSTGDSTTNVTLTAYSDPSCSTAIPGALTQTVKPVKGIVSFKNFYQNKTGNIYLKATTPLITTAPNAPCAGPLVVNPSASTALKWISPTTTQTAQANAAFTTQPVVSFRDFFDNQTVSDTGNVTLKAYTNSTCTSEAPGSLSYTPVSTVSGLATFSDVKYNKTGTIYLKAFSGALVSPCSSSITVSTNVASKLNFYAQTTSTAIVGTTTLGLSIEVTDSANNRVAQIVPVSLAAYSDSACTIELTSSLGGTTSASTAAAGTVTMSASKYQGIIGTFYVGASSPGLQQACSAPITAITGAANKLFFAAQPSSSLISGSIFSSQPEVHVQDIGGNIVTTAGTTMTLSVVSSCAGAAVGTPAFNSLIPTNGISSFTSFAYSYTIAGTYYVKATYGAITACSNAFTLSTSTGTKLTAPVAQNPASGALLATQPAIQLQTSLSANVSQSGVPVSLTLYSNNTCSTAVPGLVVNANPVFTDATGLATFSGVRIFRNTTGTVYLKASSPGITSSTCVALTVTGDNSSPTSLAFLTQPPSETLSTVPFSIQPRVEIRDGASARVTSGAYKITLASFTNNVCTTATTAGVLSATSLTVTSSSGVADFSGLTYSGTGAIYIKAYEASSNMFTSACVGPVVLPTGLSFTVTSSPMTAGVGSNFQVNFKNGASDLTTLTDLVTISAYSDTSCIYPATGTLTNNLTMAINGVASFPNLTYSKKESIRIQARSSSGLLSACTAVTVNANTPDRLAFLSLDSTVQQSVAALSVIGAVMDAYGNQSPTSGIPLTIESYSDASCTTISTSTATAKTVSTTASGTSTFSSVKFFGTIGNYYLKLSSPGYADVCGGPVAVTAGPPASVKFITQPSMLAQSGVVLSQQPIAQLQDSSGNAVSNVQHQLQLSLHTNNICTVNSSGVISASENPLLTVSGVANFSNVNVKLPSTTSATSLYLRARSVSSATITGCSNAIAFPNTPTFRLENESYFADSTVTNNLPIKVLRSSAESAPANLLMTIMDNDYATRFSQTISFSDGELQQIIVLPLSLFSSGSGTETFSIVLSSPDDSAVIERGATMEIQSASSAVSLNATTYSFYEDGSEAFKLNPSGSATPETLKIFRKSSTKTASVRVSFIGLTAEAGKDFNATSKVISFAAGESFKTLQMPILADVESEGIEKFLVKVTSEDGVTEIGSPSIAEVSLQDVSASTGTLSFSSDYYSANPSSQSTKISIQRTNGSSGPVSFFLKVIPGTAVEGIDYDLPSQQRVVFTSGETKKDIEVPVYFRGENKSFFVQLTDVTDGGIRGRHQMAKVRILDDHRGCSLGSLPFGGGSGTPADPYRVCSLNHLKNVAYYRSSSFIQTADIDAATWLGWINTKFYGTYDGREYSVLNFSHVNVDLNVPVGLFSEVMNGASVSNLNLSNIFIYANGTVGGIAGRTQGLIENSFVSGELFSNFGSYTIIALPSFVVAAGGITGYASTGAQLNQNFASVFLKAGKVSGGIVGYAGSGTQIQKSFSTGTVTINDNLEEINSIGGLVGYLYSEVADSISTSNVMGDLETGGLVGSLKGFIRDSSSHGNIYARDWAVGGLVGSANRLADNSADSLIDNSLFNGTINRSPQATETTDTFGSDYPSTIGGIAGSARNTRIFSTKVTGDIIIHDLLSKPRYLLASDLGGLVGYGFDLLITNSSFKGKISIEESPAAGAPGKFANVGGLFGVLEESFVGNSFADFEIKARSNVGGIIGVSGDNVVIGQSFARGNLKGTNSLGGLIGVASGDYFIQNSYAMVNIIADQPLAAASTYGTLGGLIGEVGGISGSITNSYFNGTLSGDEPKGNFIGSAASSFNINGSYTTAAPPNIGSGDPGIIDGVSATLLVSQLSDPNIISNFFYVGTPWRMLVSGVTPLYPVLDYECLSVIFPYSCQVIP